MIKENQKLLNRIQVVLDAGVIIVAYVLPEHFPVHRRSGLVSLSENLKTTSGESIAAPLDTSTSQEIWTPVLRFVSPTRKTGRFLLGAEPGSWQIPYLKRSMKNASTKPDPR